MIEDLISLKFLVVSGSEPFVALWREAARTASVPVEFIASDCISTGSVDASIDAVVIDNTILASRRDMAVGAARQCEPAPQIVIVDPNAEAAIENADLVLRGSDDLNAVRGLIKRIIRFHVPVRVLVVDDSGTMRSIVRKVLSASRYTFDLGEAANGHEAITELKNGEFDIVILDYNMPGLNGLDILRAIRRMERKIGVVMMTTTVDEVIARAAVAEGAVGFLKKPFYPADIDRLLDRYFETP